MLRPDAARPSERTKLRSRGRIAATTTPQTSVTAANAMKPLRQPIVSASRPAKNRPEKPPKLVAAMYRAVTPVACAGGHSSPI